MSTAYSDFRKFFGTLLFGHRMTLNGCDYSRAAIPDYKITNYQLVFS